MIDEQSAFPIAAAEPIITDNIAAITPFMVSSGCTLCVHDFI